MKKLTKSFVAITLMMCFIFANAIYISADSVNPFIKFINIPAYGSFDDIKGKVVSLDGAKIKASDYRITMFIKIIGQSSYYVKPYYDTPYTELNSDGSFVADYTTGGIDEQASEIHVFLIKSDYTPTDFYQTGEKALDYVKIERTPDGGIDVPAERLITKTSNPGKPSGLKVNKKKIGVNVGFYTTGNNGDKLSDKKINKILNATKKYADTIRIFSAAGPEKKAYKAAHKKKLNVIGTAWISGNKVADKREMDALIKLCNKGYVTIACVGSEAVYRNNVSINDIIEDINYVKSKINKKSIPVTTAETSDIFMKSASLRDTCDIIFPNCYPFFGGINVKNAASDFIDTVNMLKEKCPGKEIVISETGWPTSGASVGDAKPGLKNAAKYFDEIRKWSIESGIKVMYFSLADEKWKAKIEGSYGSHWGFLTSKLKLKKSFKKLL